MATHEYIKVWAVCTAGIGMCVLLIVFMRGLRTHTALQYIRHAVRAANEAHVRAFHVFVSAALRYDRAIGAKLGVNLNNWQGARKDSEGPLPSITEECERALERFHQSFPVRIWSERWWIISLLALLVLLIVSKFLLLRGAA